MCKNLIMLMKGRVFNLFVSILVYIIYLIIISIKQLKVWLNEEYKNEQKFNWEILIGLYPIFVLIGFLYLDSFFEEYVISYNLYFNINDCIDILYKKGAILFYLLTFTVVSLSSFSIFFFVRKRQKSINNKKVIYTILEIMIIPAIIIFAFLFVGDILSEKALSILGLILLVVSIYFFGNKNIAIILSICFFALYLNNLGEKDAKEIIKNKGNYRLNIILKENDTILRDTAPSRYLIYKTTDYIFIKDDEKNKVIIKPTSDIQEISFTP